MRQTSFDKYKTKLAGLISRNEIEEGIRELEKLVSKNNETYSSILLLKARLFQSNTTFIKGMSNDEERAKELNRIRDAILEIIDKLTLTDLKSVDEETPEIKYIIDFIEENAKLRQRNNLQEGRILQLEKELEFLKSENKKLSVKIDVNNENPELLNLLQVFFADYEEVLEKYPQLKKTVSDYSKRIFYEEAKARYILATLNKAIMKDLNDLSSYVTKIGEILDANPELGKPKLDDGYHDKYYDEHILKDILLFQKLYDIEFRTMDETEETIRGSDEEMKQAIYEPDFELVDILKEKLMRTKDMLVYLYNEME